MRRNWLCFVAIAALSVPVFGANVEFLFQSGHQSWLNGGRVLDPESLRARYGDHFAAMVRDGRTYVTTDPAALAQISRIYAPIEDLAQRQAVLGSKQAELGNEQGKIGEEQAIIGAQQAALVVSGSRTASSDLSDRQRALGEQQRRLGERQRVLGQQQRILGEQQSDFNRAAMAKIERLFDRAIESGNALPVP